MKKGLEKTEPTKAPWTVVLVRADEKGWSHDDKKDWPCGVRYQIKDDDAKPITKEEAEANAVLIQNAPAMLAALKQMSFYSRINHAKFKDYGGIADAVLTKMGQPTGAL